MRKAFDTHVAKLKPRFKTGVEVSDTIVDEMAVADPGPEMAAEMQSLPESAPEGQSEMSSEGESESYPATAAMSAEPEMVVAPVVIESAAKRTKSVARAAPVNRSESRTPPRAAGRNSAPAPMKSAVPPPRAQLPVAEEFPNGAIASLSIAGCGKIKLPKFGGNKPAPATPAA